MIARVRGVIAAAICAALILAVSSSASTNTARAPSSTIISAVATKVKGVVITSSPGLTSSAISAMRSASVPEATVTQWRAPVYAASCSSSSRTSGPRMYCPWSSTRWMRASMSRLSARYCAFRSTKSMLEEPLRENAQQIFAVAALAELACQRLELRGVDEAHAIRDLLGTGDLQVLPALDRLDEVGRFEQRLVRAGVRSEEHTSELQSPCNLVCRLLLEKKKK